MEDYSFISIQIQGELSRRLMGAADSPPVWQVSILVGELENNDC